MFVSVYVVRKSVEGNVELGKLIDPLLHLDAVHDARCLLIPLTDVLLHQSKELLVEHFLDHQVFVSAHYIQQLLFVVEGVVLLFLVVFVGQEIFEIADVDSLTLV